jgi:ribonucleoside-diphosphate reductase alpha chain
MGMMDLEHPDILKFINAKTEPGVLTNFNLSVKVGDGFMAKLKANPDKQHVVINPRTKKSHIIPRSVNVDAYTIDDLLPEGRESRGCYTVREVWDMVVKNAHATGEPGICFIDRVNEANPAPHLGRIEATNPCGEQPLLPFESCTLGSINLSKFVRKGSTDFCWDSLARVVALAVRFLDNVVDANCYIIPEIENATVGNRKIGLGVMGFADVLVLLGIRYDSDEAVEWASKVAEFIQKHAHQASENLAKEGRAARIGSLAYLTRGQYQ